MSDLLSQEELDQLLRAGIGQMDQDVEEDQFPPDEETFAPYGQPLGRPGASQGRPKMKRSAKIEEEKVPINPAVFEDFDELEEPAETTNLEIILNLNLEIRVELGKTIASVQEVLEMGPGSVLELDKLNGEPVDLFVNEKGFAKGEMIVIGESFGVRVTDILSVQERIEALGD